jgi:hypothetical protein
MDLKKDFLIAALESKVDMLETELAYLDNILVECGFPEGIKTLKMTVKELLEEDSAATQRQSSQEL